MEKQDENINKTTNQSADDELIDNFVKEEGPGFCMEDEDLKLTDEEARELDNLVKEKCIGEDQVVDDEGRLLRKTYHLRDSRVIADSVIYIKTSCGVTKMKPVHGAVSNNSLIIYESETDEFAFHGHQISLIHRHKLSNRNINIILVSGEMITIPCFNMQIQVDIFHTIIRTNTKVNLVLKRKSLYNF
jgi:hypothetical protein